MKACRPSRAVAFLILKAVKMPCVGWSRTKLPELKANNQAAIFAYLFCQGAFRAAPILAHTNVPLLLADSDFIESLFSGSVHSHVAGSSDFFFISFWVSFCRQ